MKNLALCWQYSNRVCLTLLFIFSSLMASASTSTAVNINGPNTVCEGDIETYTYPYAPGHIYTWSSTGGTGIATINTGNNTAVFTVTWGLAGSGSVNVQDYAGGALQSSSSISVTINPAPNPFIVSDFDSDCIDDTTREGQHGKPPSFDCETVCEDSPVNYTTDYVSGNTYNWTVIGSYNAISGSTTNSATVTWGSPGQAYIVVTETTPAGCTQTDTVCIEIVSKPISKFKVDQGNSSIYSVPSGSSPNAITICKGATVCFDDLSAGATSWFWDFGNGNTSQQQNPCETYNNPGTYQVMQVVENNCHCTDTSIFVVRVTNEEGPEIVCQNVVCNNGTFVYDAILPTPCAGGFYQWSISNNGTIVNLNGSGTSISPQSASGTNSTSIEINWGSGPIGVISLRISGCAGVCDRVTTVNIPIIPNTLDIEGDEVVCAGEFGYYNVPCFPGTAYQWKVNGATQPGMDHEFSYQFWGIGTYTITVDYTNNFLSCSGSSNSFTVEVLPSFSISGADKICESTTTVISGPGSSQLNWEVRDQTGTAVTPISGPSSSYTVPGSLAPGTYSVVAEDVSSPRDYCNDYAVHGITVIAKPPAPTLINGADEVCANEVYVYTASPASSDYYLEWEVTNGGGTPTTSNGNSVTVTWNAGLKEINLYHISKVGNCKSDPFLMSISDRTPPTVSLAGPNVVCANTEAASPEIYSTSALLDDYVWSISPPNAGSVVDGQGTASIEVIWNNYNGSANVVLTPVVCGNSFTAIPYPVSVSAPVMSISGTTNLCQNSNGSWTTNFTPSGSPGAYTWTVQNVATGTSITIPGTSSSNNYTFPNSGSFIVSASAVNCALTHTVSQNVTVDPAPVANLTYTGNVNCIDQNAVTFFVSVQGTGPYDYDWYRNAGFIGNFGTSHNIGNNAADAGNYSVVITDANGCTSTTNIVRVKVCSGGIICNPSGGSVSFIAQEYQTSPSPGCNVVRFQETVSGPTPTSLSWDFAGFGSASGSMPTFTFPASGVYPVTLTASYANPPYPLNTCNETYTFDVVVPVIADYELNISCAGNVFNVDLINTTDVVHGPLSSFTHNWSLFDVTAGSPIGPIVTTKDYSSVPGLIEGHVIQVTLTEAKNYTWNGQSISASCTYVNTFTMPFKADADFSVSQLEVCVGNPLTFTDNSIGNITEWLWNFGDGSTILTKNPEKTYTASGTYAVNLDITDEFGCTSNHSLNVEVKPNNLSGNINVVTSSGMMPMCPGDLATLTFANSTSPASSPYTYLWSDLSTGISTTTTQTSTHYLGVTDTYGCFRSFGPETVEVVEIPHAIINGEDEYCVGDEIGLVCNYGNTYTYEWFKFMSGSGGYVSDGTGTEFSLSNAPVGTHTFKVELTETVSGCTKESLVFTVVVHPNPVAPIITTNPVPACPDSPVLLTATNAGAFNHVTWSTGEVNPTTYANTSGTYYAVGTDVNGCSNYSSTQVHELPDFCSFMCGCYSDCIDAGGTYNFPGILGSYSQWRWERLIGGSWTTVSSGSGTVADFVATSAGNYTIRLYVKTYQGCDGYSCETDLVLVPCNSEPCEGEVKINYVKCEFDADLGVVYNYNMDIYFAPFGKDCQDFSYTIIPPFGNIQQGSNNINPYGANVFGSWYTGLSYYPGGQVCFDIVITNNCDQTSCTFTVCFEVDRCGKPGKADKRLKADDTTTGEVQFYPNPTSGILKIKAPERGNYQITIFDISGKIVFAHTMALESGRTFEFNLQDLPVGPYSIQCIGNESIKTERLIILKE